MKPEQIANILNEIARLDVMGNHQDAMTKLRPLLEVPKPGPRVVEAYAILSVHYDEQEKALGLIENTLKNFSMHPALAANLHFQSGNLYDKLKEYDQAFLHYKSANDALPVQFNAQAYEIMIKVQQQFFTRASMTGLNRADISNVTPVFIIGMPRSGSSLTEQIMDRHSRIHGAGELNTINKFMTSIQQRWSLNTPYPSCLANLSRDHLNQLAEEYFSIASKDTPNVACVTDKMPSNCGHLGLIELILPSAKVIHCLRHPIDVCLSCYFQNFGNAHQYSRRLGDLAKMYRLYLDMVNMWDGVISLPVHELRYEDMVNDQEKFSRQLIEFSGLDWEEKCLSFNESRRTINTCSYNQVRKPMYSSSVHRWKNYEKHIGPLLTELEDIVDRYNSVQS